MTKTETKAKPSQTPHPEPAHAAGALESIAERLAPVEEFRERGERWMKEVTAQVARLAGHVEHDEKRRGALDKRLADIEERIRSLLTLTELVSLDKNPFAQQEPRRAPAAPGAMPAPAAAVAAVPAPADPAPIPEARAETPPQPAEPTTGSTSFSTQDEDDDASPEGPPVPATASHPNDAAAETHTPAPPIRLSDETATGSATVPETQPAEPVPETQADTETERRLLVVAWADLLARAEPTIDLAAFTAFYAEADWVHDATARDAQRLAPRLRETPQQDPLDARRLHEATIRLLCATNPALPRFTPVETDEQPLEAR